MEPVLNLDNWAAVRVWLPINNRGELVPAHEAALTGNVGHASLQTKNLYASFWPDWKGAKKYSPKGAVFAEAKGNFFASPEEDCKEEEKEPDIVVVLYTLDTSEIERTFELFKQKSISWSILGTNVIGSLFKTGQSCSGLVYDLLKAGKIFERLTVCSDMTRDYWTVAPDAVARMVVSAKQYECDKYSSIKSFKHPNIVEIIPSYDLNPHRSTLGRFFSN